MHLVTAEVGIGAGDYDAVVIATDHRGVDYRRVAETARFVIDTRNALAKAGIALPPERMIKL